MRQEDAIEDYVRQEMRHQCIPGPALAVTRATQVVTLGAYGLANVEWNVPVTAETLFQGGSIGKQFVASAVMHLVEDGAIDLDESVRAYLNNTPDTWADITIRHLLTHTSGIGGAYALYDLRKDYTEDELLELAAAAPLRFPAGDQWEYMNTGYLVLGLLIGRVTGKHYGEVLQERIFGPLGMRTARVISQDDIILNRASGYRLDAGVLKNQEWISQTFNATADGSLYVSITDMVAWEKALAAGTALSKTSLTEMWTPAPLNDGSKAGYGFGWELTTVNGFPVMQHGGAWQGFTGYIVRYAGYDLSVIVLTNLAGASVSSIAQHVAAMFAPDLAPNTTNEPSGAE